MFDPINVTRKIFPKKRSTEDDNVVAQSQLKNEHASRAQIESYVIFF